MGKEESGVVAVAAATAASTASAEVAAVAAMAAMTSVVIDNLGNHDSKLCNHVYHKLRKMPPDNS